MTQSQEQLITRVTVNLPTKVWEAVEKMAAEDQTTRTEILRRAISTEAFLRNARREQYEVLLRTPTGNLERIVFP